MRSRFARVPVALSIGCLLATTLVGTARSDDSEQDTTATPPVTAVERAIRLGQPVRDDSQTDEFTEVVAHPDGTWTATFSPSPVRVRKGESWDEIDPTLEIGPDGKVRARAGLTETVLSGGGDDTLASMEISGHDLEWGWPSELPKPQINGATATYAEVIPGGDLIATMTPSGFRFDLLIKEPPAEPVKIDVPINLDGASIRKDSHGGFSVQSGAETILTSPEPIMWDGEGKNAKPIETELTDIGSETTTLSLTPDQQYFKDPDTQYPVTVDPSFNFAPNGDGTITNASAYGGTGSDPTLTVGTNSSGDKLRSFLKFNGIGSHLAGKQITKAELVLRNFSSNSCSAGAIGARRVTELFYFDSLDWSNQPAVASTWSASYSPAHGGPSCAAADARWDVTPAVVGWADGTYPNYGLRLHALTEGAGGPLRKYRSINYTNYVNLQPKMVVSYAGNLTVPTIENLSPCAAPNCYQEYPVIGTLTPSITAKATDVPAPGAQLDYLFEVREIENTAALVASGTASAAPSVPVTWTVPAGKLLSGVQYEVRATASNGDEQRVGLWKSFSVVENGSVQPPAIEDISGSPCLTDCSNGMILSSLAPTFTSIIPDELGLASISYQIRKAGIADLLHDVTAGISSDVSTHELPPGVLLSDGNYEIRVGHVATEDLTPPIWGTWKPFSIVLPTSAPREPLLTSASPCLTQCSELVFSSRSPTFTLKSQDPFGSPISTLQIEVHKSMDELGAPVAVGSVPNIAPGNTGTWTIPADTLSTGVYYIRFGANAGTNTTWSAIKTLTINTDVANDTDPAVENDVEVHPDDISENPQPPVPPDPSKDLEDTQSATGDPDSFETEQSAGQLPIYQRHAPRVWLHPDEEYGPMSASTFINHSTLRWSHNLGCDDHQLAERGSVSFTKLSHAYSHPERSGPCWDNGTRFYADQNVHPWKPGGPGHKEGMFLDLKNSYRDGGGFNGKEPVYFRYLPGIRIDYYFNYGFSRTYGGLTGMASWFPHEGDWEHISIALDRYNTPLAVKYWYHKEDCYLPWSKVPKYKGHPVIWVARNAHGSYPKGGKSLHVAGVPVDSMAEGDFWPTSRNMRNLFLEDWYGYTGAWGEVGDAPNITGPWGPNPIRDPMGPPALKSAGLCKFA